MCMSFVLICILCANIPIRKQDLQEGVRACKTGREEMSMWKCVTDNSAWVCVRQRGRSFFSSSMLCYVRRYLIFLKNRQNDTWWRNEGNRAFLLYNWFHWSFLVILLVHELVWKWWREITDTMTTQKLLEGYIQGGQLPYLLEVRHGKPDKCVHLIWGKDATIHRTSWDCCKSLPRVCVRQLLAPSKAKHNREAKNCHLLQIPVIKCSDF